MKNIEIKKRYGIKVIAVTTAFALTVSGLTGCAKKDSSSTAAAATAEETQSSEELENQLNEAIGSGNVDDDNESSLSDPGAAPSKNEVVYIMADANGNCDKVVVSDWIKNTKGNSEVADVSDLKDITNTKGNAKYDLDSNGNLTWNADGKDVHYQGTTDKKPPVSVKVSYKLDGKDISPKDIAGKSGKVTIRFDYTNNETKKVVINGKEEEIKVPFAMVSGLMLDSKKFTNVKVTNGKQLDSGKSDMIVGMAFPGLSESIDLDGMKDKAVDEDAKKKVEDIQIPEYFEITANVKDFELQQTMTMASSDVLSQLDMTSDTIDTSSLTKSMNDLSNGMNSLEDGGKQLQDGTKTLKDGTADLSSGTHELASKSKDLDKGVSELSDGAKDLNDGAKSLDDGAKTLSSGLCDIDSGAGSLKDGTNTLAAGTSSLVSGAGKLDDGAAQLQNGINSYSSAVDTYLGAGSELQLGTASASQTSQLLTAYITQYISEDNSASREANIESLLESQLNQKSLLQQSLSISQMSLDEAEDEQAAAEAELISVAQGDEQVLQVVKGTEETEISVPVSVKSVSSTNTSTLNTGTSTTSTSNTSTSSTSTSDTADTADGTASDTNTSTTGQSTETPVQTSTSGMTDNPGDGASTGSDTTTSTESGSTGAASTPGSTTSALVMGYSDEQNDEDGESISDVCQKVNGTVIVTTPIVEDETVNTVDQEEVQSAVASLQSANDNVVSMSKAVVMKQAQVETLDNSINQIYAAMLQKKGMSAETISGMTTDQIKATVASGYSVSTDKLDNSTELYYIKQMASGLSKGLDDLQTGEQNVYSGLSGEDTMGALKSGASDLKNGTSSAVSGAGELDSGARKLASGASALKDGTAKAYSGSVTLMNGTTSLLDGTGSLLDGTSEMKDGTSKLVSGTKDLDDGAGELDDGVSKLADGVNDLTDGLFKLDDEGISKLTDMFGDNVSDVVDRLKAVESAGNDYTSFSGSSDSMNSNVKFVYKTDAILVDDKN